MSRLYQNTMKHIEQDTAESAKGNHNMPNMANTAPCSFQWGGNKTHCPGNLYQHMIVVGSQALHSRRKVQTMIGDKGV